MPSSSIMAAALTRPMPGSASSISDTFILAMAGSEAPDLMRSSTESAPDLSFSFAAALAARAAAALFSASPRSPGVKGGKLTYVIPVSSDRSTAADAESPERTLWLSPKSMPQPGSSGSNVRRAASRREVTAGPAERISRLEVPRTWA